MGGFTFKLCFFLALIWLVDSSNDCTNDPDPCTNPRVLNATDRLFTRPAGNACDSNLVEGWYRFEFTDGSRAQIPTLCIKGRRGGTRLPMRLDLSGEDLPSVNQTMSAHVCTAFEVLGKWDCCILRTGACVRNCSDHYVYYLTNTDRCPVRYVVQRPEANPGGDHTAKTGDNSDERHASSTQSAVSFTTDDVTESALTGSTTTPGVTAVYASTSSTQAQSDHNGTTYACYSTRRCIWQDGEERILCMHGNGSGIPCDNFPDCSDNSDETEKMNCSGITCTEGMPACPGGNACFTRCDNVEQCSDGSDELNCGDSPDTRNTTVTVPSSNVGPSATRATPTSTVTDVSHSSTSRSSAVAEKLTSGLDSASTQVTTTVETETTSADISQRSSEQTSTLSQSTTESPTPYLAVTASTMVTPNYSYHQNMTATTAPQATKTATPSQTNGSTRTSAVTEFPTSTVHGNDTSVSKTSSTVSTTRDQEEISSVGDTTNDNSTITQSTTSSYMTSGAASYSTISTTVLVSKSSNTSEPSSGESHSISVTRIPTSTMVSSTLLTPIEENPTTPAPHSDSTVADVQSTSLSSLLTPSTFEVASTTPTVTASSLSPTTVLSIDTSKHSTSTPSPSHTTVLQTEERTTPLSSSTTTNTRTTSSTLQSVTSNITTQASGKKSSTTTLTTSTALPSVAQTATSSSMSSLLTVISSAETSKTSTGARSSVPTTTAQNMISTVKITSVTPQTSTVRTLFSITISSTQSPLLQSTTVSSSASSSGSTRSVVTTITPSSRRTELLTSPTVLNTTSTLRPTPKSTTTTTATTTASAMQSSSAQTPKSDRTTTSSDVSETTLASNATTISNATLFTPTGPYDGIFGNNEGLFIFLIATAVVLVGAAVFGIVGLIYFRRLRTWSPGMSFQDAYAESEKASTPSKKEKCGFENPIPDVDILKGEQAESPSNASTLVCDPTPDSLHAMDETGQNGYQSSATKQAAVYADLTSGQDNRGISGDDYVDGDGIVPIDDLDHMKPRIMFPWIEAAEDTKL